MMKEAFSVVLLAGGQSRRMGRDKAMLPWYRETLLSSLLKKYRSLSEDVIVAGHLGRPLPPGVRGVEDVFPGQGPLAGLHAGLLSARCEWVFVSACDTPFFPLAMVQALTETAIQKKLEGAAILYKGRPEPLLACYRRSCVPVIETMLTQGEGRVYRLLEHIQWEGISRPPGLEDIWFFNINTKEEYHIALSKAP